MIGKYVEIFCWKNVSSFCSAKATHIFSAKNIIILYIESAKTVNEMILNELVKLTTLWTTGPSMWSAAVVTSTSRVIMYNIRVDQNQLYSVSMIGTIYWYSIFKTHTLCIRNAHGLCECIFWPRHVKTSSGICRLSRCAVWSGPLLSADRIIGHYRMYQWRANVMMIL